MNKIQSVISLNLTKEEAQALFLKAAGAGLSVPELLENFIADLTSSERRNGSDECMLASEWFERCWFAFDYGRKVTFSKWLADQYRLEEAFDALKEIEAIKAELEDPDEYTPEELETGRADLAAWEEQLNALLDEYEKDPYTIQAMEKMHQTRQDRGAALEDLKETLFNYMVIVEGVIHNPPKEGGAR